LSERISLRRDTVGIRMEKVASLARSMDGPVIIWCDLNSEADELKKLMPEAVEIRGNDKDTVKASRILEFADGKIPLPSFSVPTVPAVTVEEPDAEMKRTVAPVAAALRSLPPGDRMLWAATWNKAAIVVAGDSVAREVAFTDTRSLQAFTRLALDIAWRRIGGHEPGGNEPMRKALEAAYGAAVGTDDVPVTRDIRDRYAAFAKAVAWAGMNGG
jgi:hypothetical protein